MPVPPRSISPDYSSLHSNKDWEIDRRNEDNILKQIGRRLYDDEYDVVGKNFGLKLRQLPQDVRMVTEKLMTEILFEALMGKISTGTKVIIVNGDDSSEMP